MTTATAIERYKKNIILSAPPGKLLLMLYDGAIKNMNTAVQKLKENDRAGFSLHIGKGQAIISELLSSLDMKIGGEIAKNLENLYLFVINQLTESNIKCTDKGIVHALHIIRTLKDGWHEAIKKTSNEHA
ncbi:MAG: flagellar export chaperone FliS [Planctomycetota bacterium]